MTTLDTRITEKLAAFAARKAAAAGLGVVVAELRARFGECDANARPAEYFEIKAQLDDAEGRHRHALAADDEEIEFLLKSVPYIQEYAADEEDVPQSPSGLSKFLNITGVSQRSKVFTEYLHHVEGIYSTTARDERAQNAEHVCDVCETSLLFDQRQSAMVCTGCGITFQHMESSVRNLNYSEEMELNPHSTFSYKRLNHLSEWLNTLQAKENTVVPDEVIDAVKSEFRKSRLTTRGDIKPTKVRAFLKKLGLSRWYEHTHSITNTLNGTPSPKLPSALEDKLKKMFLEIQAPFEKHRPANRSNFLSYAFCLHKFCELLGEDEYLVFFPLLKSNTKLFAQDKIWRDICRTLDWEFIASV